MSQKSIYQNKGRIQTVLLILFITFLSSCVKNKDFDSLDASCSADLVTNTTFTQVKALYDEETLQIQEDLIIEGYVISSDKAGNFFGILHFQDAPANPNDALQIEIDLRDSHLFFGVGDKILLRLKGLYLGKSKDVFKLGGTFTSFGNVSVGRLPSNAVFEHVFVSCDVKETIVPTPIRISADLESNANTLVTLPNIEFAITELGLPFALDEEETRRLLVDCTDNEIEIVNSGFSDFKAALLPEGSGSITGLLIQENDDFYLQIRDLKDINFIEERCEDVIDEFTSQEIFFSELADPENNTKARFVELYNASTVPLSLKGWKIYRYTNASLEVSSSLDLSDYTINPQSTLVISPDADEFLTVYGFIPDVPAGTNSPADSNGDDNLQLVDPFGTLIDAFGIVGVDGSGTNHEFEDGRAIRKIEVSKANDRYSYTEWLVYNDTGGAETINLPQIAPNDYNPGIR